MVAGRRAFPVGAGGVVVCLRTNRLGRDNLIGSERPHSGVVWIIWCPKWDCSIRHIMAESSLFAVCREQGLISCPDRPKS